LGKSELKIESFGLYYSFFPEFSACRPAFSCWQIAFPSLSGFALIRQGADSLPTD